MFKQITLLFILALLFACGGDGGSIQNIRAKVEDAPDNLKFFCEFYFSINELDLTPEYVDEVKFITCSGVGGDSTEVNINNIDYFENITTLHLGGYATIGNIDVLPKLTELRALSIRGYFKTSSAMAWEELKLERLSISNTDLSSPDTSFINKIKSLKEVYIGTDVNITHVSNLPSLKFLEIRTGSLDLGGISNLDNIETLILGPDGGHITSGYMDLQGEQLLEDLPKLSVVKFEDVIVSDFVFFRSLENLKSYDYTTSASNLFNEAIELKCGNQLTTLKLSAGITSLVVDPSCVNLKSLNLQSNSIRDVSSISSLKQLENLDLSFNHGFSNSFPLDILPLNELPKLIQLNLNNTTLKNPPTDIKCGNDLTILNLGAIASRTANYDVVPIRKFALDQSCKNLISLDISGNGVEDITSLSFLKNLKVLEASFNNVNNLDLVEFTQLKRASFQRNEIDNLNTLKCGDKLEELEFHGNGISSLLFENSCKNIIILSLSFNEIKDIFQLSTLKNIQNISVAGNEISDLSPLYELKKLRKIDISYNQTSFDDVETLRSKLPLAEVIFMTNMSPRNRKFFQF